MPGATAAMSRTPARNSGWRARRNVQRVIGCESCDASNTHAGLQREAAQEIGRLQALAAGALQVGQRAARPRRRRRRCPARSRPAPVPGCARGATAPAARPPRTSGSHRHRAGRAPGKGSKARMRRADGGRDCVQSIAASCLVDLVGVGHALGRLRPGCSPPQAASSSASTIRRPPSAASRSCRLAGGVAAARSAMRLASSMSPVSRPASICMMVMPVSASPASMARWIGAAPRQRGSSEAWILRQPSRGRVQHPLRQDQAVGGDHHHVGAAPPAMAARAAAASSGYLPSSRRLRGCATGNAVLQRELLDAARPAASCRGRPGGRAGSAPAGRRSRRHAVRQRDRANSGCRQK